MNCDHLFLVFQLTQSFNAVYSFKQIHLSSFIPPHSLYNWMSVFLPPVVTLLAVRLSCRLWVTSCAGAPRHVVPAYGKPCPSGRLQWLTMLILSVVPDANTRGRVNRAQTDKHSRWRRGEVLRESGGTLKRERPVPTRQESMDWIRTDSVRKCLRESRRDTESCRG